MGIFLGGVLFGFPKSQLGPPEYNQLSQSRAEWEANLEKYQLRLSKKCSYVHNSSELNLLRRALPLQRIADTILSWKH